jgi:toxin ParE1/3/4
MRLEIVYRPAALSDLDTIYDYLALEDPRRAIAFIDEIRERCRVLRDYPELGPARENLAPGIRIYPMPHRVIVAYRITEATIEVTRVFSGGQDYESLILTSEGEI